MGAVRAAGFTSTRVLVPHEMPLRALTNAFRSTSLLLTAHGSGMINQVYESVGKHVKASRANVHTTRHYDTTLTTLPDLDACWRGRP